MPHMYAAHPPFPAHVPPAYDPSHKQMHVTSFPPRTSRHSSGGKAAQHISTVSGGVIEGRVKDADAIKLFIGQVCVNWVDVRVWGSVVVRHGTVWIYI